MMVIPEMRRAHNLGFCSCKCIYIYIYIDVCIIYFISCDCMMISSLSYTIY